MHGDWVDVLAADEMRPLIVRGREALFRHFEQLPPEARPIGGAGAALTIDVVTDVDFCLQARVLLRHVVRNAAPMHILCKGNSLCALLEPHPGRW